MRGYAFKTFCIALCAVSSGLATTAKASFVVRLEVVGRDINGNPVLLDQQTLTDVDGDGIIGGDVNLVNYEFTDFLATSTLTNANRLDLVTEGGLTINGVVQRLTPNVNNEELRIWVSDTGFRINHLPLVRSHDSAGISWTLPTNLSYTLASFADPMDRLFGLDSVGNPLPNPQPPVLSNTLSPAITSDVTRSGGIPFQELSSAPEMISVTNRSTIILAGPSVAGQTTLEQMTFTGTTTIFAIPEPAAAITFVLGAAGLTLVLRRRSHGLKP